MGKVKKILPPCTYQGAKQRVSTEIVDIILEENEVDEHTKFYDLCSGTGAISLELIARGFNPENIIMLDKSSWGKFWYKVGRGEYDIDKFNEYIDDVPEDRFKIQDYLRNLALENPDIDEEYRYILLQAGSFGGKQVWRDSEKWNTHGFRNYWQPTETSVRRSPVNPMQPMPDTIKNRMDIILNKCEGLTCLNYDIWNFLEYIRFRDTNNSVIYIDPPYKSSTGYAFSFDWIEFVEHLRKEVSAPIYVSEKEQYSEEARQLSFRGAKGGISGNRKNKNEEWLNIYR